MTPDPDLPDPRTGPERAAAFLEGIDPSTSTTTAVAVLMCEAGDALQLGDPEYALPLAFQAIELAQRWRLEVLKQKAAASN